MGPEVVSHFVMHGKTVAETIKHMLMILKKNMKNAELSSLYLESIKRVSDLYVHKVKTCTCPHMVPHPSVCNMCVHEYGFGLALCITRLAQRLWRIDRN